MKRTFVTTPPADLPDLATGYTRRLPSKPRGPAPFTDGRGITAAANMTTCVSDADDGTPTMVVDEAYQWVAPAIRKVVAPAPLGAAPAGWEHYTGKYRSPTRCSRSRGCSRSPSTRSASRRRTASASTASSSLRDRHRRPRRPREDNVLTPTNAW